MAFDTRIRRDREVRDIYNKLRKKYRADVAADWVTRNYFITKESLYLMLRRCDDEPVTNPSELYKMAMSDDFRP